MGIGDRINFLWQKGKEWAETQLDRYSANRVKDINQRNNLNYEKHLNFLAENPEHMTVSELYGKEAEILGITDKEKADYIQQWTKSGNLSRLDATALLSYFLKEDQKKKNSPFLYQTPEQDRAKAYLENYLLDMFDKESSEIPQLTQLENKWKNTIGSIVENHPGAYRKLALASIPIFALSLYGGSGSDTKAQSGGDPVFKATDYATINGSTFTADDSTAVIDHLVRLKLASGEQVDSAYTNGSNSWQFVNVPTPVENENPGLPSGFRLYQNYPNPFNPHTTIRYDLQESTPVSLKIFNIQGKEIANLVSEEQSAGQHEATWNGRNAGGEQVAQGVYFYYLNAGKFNEAKKMIYLHGSVPHSGTNGSMPKENFSGNQAQKPGSADYLVEIVNLAGTSPQVINTQHFFTLSNDTSFNVYVPRQGTPVADIDIASLVQMLSGMVPGKYETVQLKQGSNVIQSKNTGESGTALFENVPKNQNYTVHFFGDTASRPNISAGDFPIFLVGDTAIVVNPQLYLRPTVLANLENKTFNEDEYPANPRMHDLWTKATGYDSLGNQVNPAALLYLIQNQSNPNLAPVIIEANQYTKLDGLLPDGNGTNNVTVRAIAPNSQSADKGFNVQIVAQPDRKGQLTDTEGNPRQGYIYARNAAGQQFILQTNPDGTFAYQLQPSAWDSLKGQIQNDVRPSEGGFIRALYFTTNNDLNNINVDAVPHLNGADYIGLDTLDSFIKEANFDAPQGNNVGKLKKADLDNMLNFITSHTQAYGDTITSPEQDYIINIISQRIDPFFDQPSAKWKVPQDSMVTSWKENAINWVKDKEGPLGAIVVWDDNGDGIFDKSRIRLSYIRNIIGQDTTYNNRAIVQEGLSGTVAPGEVGTISPIGTDKTVLHKNTSRENLQPADKWLVDIAKNYPVLTNHDDILKIGNLATAYNKALNGKGPIIIANKYVNVDKYKK